MAIITSRTNENGRITFSYDLCNSCGLCVKVCKDFSLKMENNKPVVIIVWELNEVLPMLLLLPTRLPITVCL